MQNSGVQSQLQYELLGIRSANGTPLPRLCLAQLPLTLLIEYLDRLAYSKPIKEN